MSIGSNINDIIIIDDILMNIFNQLSSARDRCTVRIVCERWRSIVDNEYYNSGYWDIVQLKVISKEDIELKAKHCGKFITSVYVKFYYGCTVEDISNAFVKLKSVELSCMFI